MQTNLIASSFLKVGYIFSFMLLHLKIHFKRMQHNLITFVFTSTFDGYDQNFLIFVFFSVFFKSHWFNILKQIINLLLFIFFDFKKFHFPLFYLNS